MPIFSKPDANVLIISLKALKNCSPVAAVANRQSIRQLLTDRKKLQSARAIECIVSGCTHYALLTWQKIRAYRGLIILSKFAAMNHWTLPITSLLIASFMLCSDVSAQEFPMEEPVHSSLEANFPVAPRLFLGATQLSEIRSAIAIPGSHHQVAFAAIKSRVDQNDWHIYDENPDDGNWNYARAWLAREASFLYWITGEQTYAQIAFDSLDAIHNDPDPDGRIPEANYGLSRAATGMGFALAYCDNDGSKGGIHTTSFAQGQQQQKKQCYCCGKEGISVQTVTRNILYQGKIGM